MKKVLCLFLVSTILFVAMPLAGHGAVELDDNVPSAILVEARTGKILYEKDADLELAPASVTKVMTMLLIMEAVDGGTLSYNDMITASANAASMGGSQVYLKEGEQMSVSDMLKAITMASANDACVAMAEHIAGSEEAFVQLMNQRAVELGMEHTNFENTNGLDDTTTSHYTSARDIAIMSRQLIVFHPDILKYTSVWMDSLRDGTFGLTNTNRLVRFYKGANGLKTGSTSRAGFCISAAAERDGMQLIAVIMKAPDRDTRNEAAKKLLDYGFATYSTVCYEADTLSTQPIIGGTVETTDFYIPPYYDIVEKGRGAEIEKKITLNDDIKAPLKEGDTVGKIQYTLDGELLHEANILASENVERITYFDIITRIFKEFLSL